MTANLSRYAEDGARQLDGYRWPVVSTAYPRWSYVTTLVVDPTLYGDVMPTKAELAVVNSFHEEYMTHWYRPGWVEQMREQHAFDVDGGANGRYLLKVAHGSWKYRLSTWHHGPWPFYNAEPMDLLPLLDHVHHDGQRWMDWKAAHADVFEAVTA